MSQNQTENRTITGALSNGSVDLPIPAIEYGLTAAIAIFLIRWVVVTLAKELETIKTLLGKQLDQARDLHSCVDSLRRDFHEARNEAKDLGRLISEKTRKGWRE